MIMQTMACIEYLIRN